MTATSPASPALQRRAELAHARLGTTGNAFAGLDGAEFPRLRRVVRDSWARSLTFHPDPSGAAARLALTDPQLREFRRTHALASVMPVIDKLLIQPARDTGLIVAVGDEAGRLLWVEGDTASLRSAERMEFVPGAEWSERAVGTSAPGTALATGAGVQVSGAEHFSPVAHRWSCSAVPIHCPFTGKLLGVIDLTGQEDAVAGHSLALLQAAAAAAEAQMRINAFTGRGGLADAGGRAGIALEPHASAATLLRVLGNGTGALEYGMDRRPLGGRHAEILTLLAWYRHGLHAGELSELLFGDPDQQTSVRAEIVRLRRTIGAGAAAIGLESRPYRVAPTARLDAREVVRHVAAGRYRDALRTYAGPVLPRSTAPGVENIRLEVAGTLREAMLSDADPDTLMDYLELPEASDDVEALRTALQILPADSPARSVVVTRLQRIDARLA